MSGVAMGTRYSHLTLVERCRLCGLMEMGLSRSEIARRLAIHCGGFGAWGWQAERCRRAGRGRGSVFGVDRPSISGRLAACGVMRRQVAPGSRRAG
jgi:hypothetical protein